MNEVISQASIGAEIVVEAVLSQYPDYVTKGGKELLIAALVETIKSTASKLYAISRTGMKV